MATINKSTGLQNAIAQGYGLKEALANCRLRIYSGSLPATADTAAAGTLLLTFTLSGGSFTAETRATATVQLSAGASGSVDTVVAGGFVNLIGAAVPFNTSLNQTASDLAAAINAYPSFPKFTATVSTDTVTIYAPYTYGAVMNTMDITSATTTLTSVDVDFASGVTAINGLNWDLGTGELNKEATVWQGTTISAGGTAGWYRFEADSADDQGASVIYRRMDGDIATSGAALNLGSTALGGDSVHTLNQWDLDIKDTDS